MGFKLGILQILASNNKCDGVERKTEVKTARGDGKIAD